MRLVVPNPFVAEDVFTNPNDWLANALIELEKY